MVSRIFLIFLREAGGTSYSRWRLQQLQLSRCRLHAKGIDLTNSITLGPWLGRDFHPSVLIGKDRSYFSCSLPPKFVVAQWNWFLPESCCMNLKDYVWKEFSFQPYLNFASLPDLRHNYAIWSLLYAVSWLKYFPFPSLLKLYTEQVCLLEPLGPQLIYRSAACVVDATYFLQPMK